MNPFARFATAFLLAWAGHTILAPSLKAETYEGNMVEVLDAIGADLPNAQIGIDPIVMRVLLEKDVSVTIGNQWAADLNNFLRHEQLTSIGLKGYRHRMVTYPSALREFKGIEALGKGDFNEAEEHFNAALKEEPDNIQIVALKRLGRDLEPLHKDVRRQRDRIAESLRVRDFEHEDRERLTARTVDYLQAVAKFWTTFDEDIDVAAATGLDAELFPILEFANKEMDWHARVMKAVGKKIRDDSFHEMVDAAKAGRKHIDDIYMFAKTSVDKAEKLATEAEERMKRNDNAAAMALLLEAMDQDATNLRVRVHLSWLMADQRQGLKKQRLATIQDKSRMLSPTKQTAHWNKLADQAVQRHDRLQARVLLALDRATESEIGLSASNLTALKRLDEGVTEAPEYGVIDGLVTAGGEYTGGEVFPFSVSLEERRDFSSYHELVVNDLAQSFDMYMLVSFQQAFAWLDQQAGGIMHNYRITIHFKDLESSKGGDSLGAALGTAGFSSLYQIPRRSGVTMTGSIRAYGGIGPVGGIPAKLNAAIKDGKHTIIVPADNEAELMMVSQDSLSGIRVLMADKIDVYLIHALDGARPHEEEDSYRLAEAWFFVARELEAMGRHAEAYAIYRRVQAAVPYDYTAANTVALYEEVGVKAALPDWFEKFTLEPNVERKEQPYREQLAEVLTAHAAAMLAGDEDEAMFGDRLLSTALLLDPKQRDALLLRAKLMRQMKIKKPETVEQNAATAKRLMAAVDALKDDPSPAARAEAGLFTALVLEHFDPENEAALVAFARSAEGGGQPLQVRTELGKLERLLGVVDTDHFLLTPLAVQLVDRTLLPTSGIIWGEDADVKAGVANNDDEEAEQDADADKDDDENFEAGGVPIGDD